MGDWNLLKRDWNVFVSVWDLFVGDWNLIVEDIKLKNVFFVFCLKFYFKYFGVIYVIWYLVVRGIWFDSICFYLIW